MIVFRIVFDASIVGIDVSIFLYFVSVIFSFWRFWFSVEIGTEWEFLKCL